VGVVVIGVTVVVVSLVGGMFGGGITAVFLEVYLQRRADEVVGAYDLPTDSHRAS